MGYNTVGANDVTSVVDYPLGVHIRTSAQLTGRPTLRLSLGNIDSFMCQSDTIPSSTTWQSPQGPLRSASPKLAIRPSSSGVGLGRLSWQSALTPRTTASRSVVNDLPSWPARPASHSRPRGPRPHVGRSPRTLYRDQDIPDAREDTTVSLSQRRADDGGVRLAGGPLPMAMQAAPSGDKGRSDGRVSGSGSGSSEDTLPPAYAVY
ncbi:hypothetical protein C8Q72DRAFT_860362 [Fomitopsis betulina]|nr:hypothetical protein C8Q72DRAFT_860362 [Fomitopsis betulina]